MNWEEWIHVHVWLSPFAVPKTITTLLIGYTPIQNKKFNKNLNNYGQLCTYCHVITHFLVFFFFLVLLSSFPLFLFLWLMIFFNNILMFLSL